MKSISQATLRILVMIMLYAITGLSAGSAYASSVYFLQIGDIKGESTDRGHPDWIDINSFSWGINVPAATGTGGGATAGKAVFSPFSWTQQLDASVPSLFVGAASGSHFPKATLDVMLTGAKTALVYFRMEFDNVILTSLDIHGSGDRPGVAGKLVYSKVTMTYWPTNLDGKSGAPIIGGWDLTKNTSSAFFGSPEVLQGLLLAEPAISAVPVPAAIWLFGSGLLGLVTVARKKA
jgi:type VI secretion system Hcp family effector